MHICFAHFSTHYVNTAGGVENVTCQFANEMVRRGHEVTILYLDDVEGPPYFPLDEKVKEINILFKDGKQVISKKLPTALEIKREITRLFNRTKAREINAIHKGRAYGKRIKEVLDEIKPDVIISCSIASTKYVIEDAKSTIPLITMMLGDPIQEFPVFSKAEIEAGKKGKGLQILLPKGLGIAEKTFAPLPIHAVGLPVISISEEERADLSKEKDIYTIVSAASMNSRKNQKLLVQAFETIVESGKFENWNLELYGYAETRYGKELAGYISEHKLSNRVLFKGITKDLNKVYGQSDIFALLSHSEGFPLALTGAMSCGLPAIGLKTCFGVNDLIQNEKTGFLVEDTVEAVEAALVKLMEDRERRIRMGEEGVEFVKQYAPEKIWDQWEELINEAANNK